jgi:hypothetical protein
MLIGGVMARPGARRIGGLLLILALGLSGCSVKLAYNNLDRLARWSVSDYLTLDPRQRAYFDAAVAEVWVWHRSDHLPRYADFLEALGPGLEDGSSESAMVDLVNVVLGWAEEIEARAVPVAAELLASLSDQQVADLAVNLEARNIEIAEPEQDVPLAEAQVLWQEEISDRFENFSGRLNSLQQAYLAQQAERYQPERVLWAEYRRRWQQDLLALLRHRQDVAGFQRGFGELAANRELYYGPELEAVFANNEALVREASVWLLNSLTDAQKARFRDRLDGLALDLRDLATDRRRGKVSDAELPCLVGC